MENKKLLGYLGGDIMTRGSNLARQEEYDKFLEAGIPGEVYSPVQNKSINDKSNMTEEENNCLAEKIVAADVERLWNSDYTVMCPEQSAIGTMCEMGVLYGWKYMADMIMHEVHDYIYDHFKGNNKWPPQLGELTVEQKAQLFDFIEKRLVEQYQKKNYAHYFDIRTNHLNEKDWRRSFSINQFLYGIILAATADGTLHNSFDEIIPLLQKEYIKEEQLTFESEWR
jgi:nucleoside 2-deoxyribosyltransferase